MTGIELLGRRWAPEIVLALDRGPLNFNRLLDIPGISDRVLTERLRELEATRLIDRRVIVDRPVRVTYGLTPSGRTFLAPLEQLAGLTSEPPQEVAV